MEKKARLSLSIRFDGAAMRTPFLKPLGTAVLAVLTFLLYSGCSQQDSAASTGGGTSAPITSTPIASAPDNAVPVANIPAPKEPAKADLGDGLYAEFNTTKGKILLSLEFEKTPLTVANFVGLAEGTKDSNKPKGTKFYDGLNFHRVIADFMIQGGCPQGTGTGGPGYKFADEIDPTLKHIGPGILSMANSGPATNGSQFFITHKATPWLDGKHTVFGKVVGPADQKVVNAIAKGDKLNSVKIIRIGEKAKAFRGDEEHYKKLMTDKEKSKTVKFEAQMKKEAEQIGKLVADLKKKHKADMVTSKTGLRYIITQSGEGEVPEDGDNLMLHLKFKLADGQVIDDTRENKEPMAIPAGAEMRLKGLAEGISGMKKGEHRTVIVPHKLGFGEAGAGGKIPPFATLIFELELTDVKSGKTPATETDKKLVKAIIAKLEKDHPKAKLVTTKSGLRYVVTKAGAGEKVGNGKKIKAHYTGRLLDGTEFDSSVKRDVPFEFVVGTGQVIKGWDEALSDMKKGEKRTLIIPHALAYGEGGRPPTIPPAATLVFDVELVDF